MTDVENERREKIDENVEFEMRKLMDVCQDQLKSFN